MLASILTSESSVEGDKVVQVGRFESFSISLCQRIWEFLYYLFPIFCPFVFQDFVLNTKPEKPVAFDKSLINLFIRIAFGTVNNCTSIFIQIVAASRLYEAHRNSYRLCFSFQMVFFALCKEIFEFLIGGVPEHVGKISIKQVFFFGEMRWKMYLCGKQSKNALRWSTL